MSLARHVKVEEVIHKARDHTHRKYIENKREYHDSAYNSRYGTEDVPKFTLPSTGVSAKSAYQMVHDELELDGSPSLNFASFVHTWMPEEAQRLFMENIGKNFADQDEYPATMAIHTRCISMIADLWKAPKDCKAIGTATAGSSEAIMLGGLAMKRRWQERRKAEGKDHFHPNVIMGANAQVAIEKFARYFDVECRLVPVTKESDYVMSPKDAMQYVDENTIGVFVILGSTYTGAFEDVKGMSDLLDEYQQKTGIDIPIHVDAASGGFLAPFAYPKYKWAFDIPRVRSINTSGHKYGLVYVGLGWILWKDEQYLPKDLIFELHYLGSTEYSYTLNFSRPAAPILGQMFNFLHLGFEGYRRIALNDLKNARMLSRALELTEYYKVVSKVHLTLPEGSTLMGSVAKAVGATDDDKAENYYPGLPVVAFHFSDTFKQENPNVRQEWIQTLLRTKQWIVPNYALPPNEQDTEILRIVVRESMTADIIERVITDICEATESLINKDTDAAMLATVSATTKSDNRIESDHKFVRKPERKQTAYAKQC
jgi:glutamate decarboxylase